MYKNNLKIAIRNLLKNKTQSAILIGGLTAGMAACLILLQYVNFELSFDNFHSKKENIYRVVNERIQNGASVQKGTITYPLIGYTMLEEYPEVKNATRIAYSSDVMITKGDRIEPVEPGLWVDEHFFEIFDFDLLARSGLDLLKETNEIILTRQLANRYFPAAKDNYETILGQELQIDRYPEAFKIVGVCEDVPKNSLLEFDLLISYASCIRYWGEGADNSWTWSDFYHYLEMEPETDVAALEAKFTDFSQRHFRGAEVSGSEEIFTLQPFSEAHFYSSGLEYEIGQTVNGKAVWSLLIIAFFILLIAWINYVNLSSVRAIERAKEVGVRKVLGASRGQLVRQFIVEALIVNSVGLLLALSVVEVLNPWINTNFAIDASMFNFLSGDLVTVYLLLSLVGLLLLGVLVSGIYPAWLMSSPQVSSVLKNVFIRNLGGASMRKILVVFQFTVSIALITLTWVVSNQIDFMSKQDLGINIDQVMNVNAPELSQWDSTFIDKMNTFKKDLAKFPSIKSAATSSRSPGERMGRVFQIQKLGEGNTDQSFTSNFMHADFEYGKTYGLEQLAGRFFRETDHSPDWNALDKIVMTETTVQVLGYTDNEAAVGQRIRFWDKDWSIVGVVPDFHQRSLHHSIEPIIFLPGYSPGNLLSLNISGENIDETIAQVKTTYQQFFPGNTFQYSFLDERFQQLYHADLRFRNILWFFTLFTVLIACLGLFGLASYTTYLRTKEIGVRKVLGATTIGIIGLLSKDFLKLVGLALIFAFPLAYFFMGKWLEGFAYQTAIQWWVFVVAGIVALAVAFFTVSFQGVKVAMTNPAESLRSE